MEGPESSNRRAPPTRHTAILDRFNSSFLFLHRFTAESLGFFTARLGVAGGEAEVLNVVFPGSWNVWLRMKDRRGAKEDKGFLGLAESETNKKRKSGGIMRSRSRQSRSETLRENCMVIFKPFFSISSTFSWTWLLPLEKEIQITRVKEKSQRAVNTTWFEADGPGFWREEIQLRGDIGALSGVLLGIRRFNAFSIKLATHRSEFLDSWCFTTTLAVFVSSG